MPLLHAPESKLGGLVAFTVMLSALLIAIEATLVGAGGTRAFRGPRNVPETPNPVSWFFLVALLWIVGFPMWMYRRSLYGLKNMCAVSVIVAVIFAGTALFLSVALHQQREALALEGLRESLERLRELNRTLFLDK